MTRRPQARFSAKVMEDLLIEWGLPALFTLSFLAATVLPISSEWLLAILIFNQQSLFATVTIATLGNTLGAITTWGLGIWGANWLIHKVLRISSRERALAEKWYNRWGLWSLLLAWTPILGDALCLIGGILRVPIIPFSLLVATGKGLRYLLVAWGTLQIST